MQMAVHPGDDPQRQEQDQQYGDYSENFQCRGIMNYGDV